MSGSRKRAAIAATSVVVLGGAIVAGTLIWEPASVVAWCGGIIAAAAAGYLSQGVPHHISAGVARRRERTRLETTDPVTCTAEVRDSDYVTLTEGNHTTDVPASGHTLQLVVTGAWPTPVVLTGLRPEVLTRQRRTGDLAQHAAALPLRRFEVLLDADPPQVRVLSGRDFPFGVKQDEVEVFNLRVTTDSGDVRWVLWLDWSAHGRRGSVRIDHGHDQAFRTAARHPALA
jgi:hypothetical protein